MSLNKINQLRKEILNDLDMLKLRTIWNVADLIVKADPDEEDVLHQLDINEEQEQEQEEENEDEAAKWLKQKEENISKEKKDEGFLQNILNLGNQQTELQSNRFGTINFSVVQTGKWPNDPSDPPQGFPELLFNITNKEKLTNAFKNVNTWVFLQQLSASDNSLFYDFLQNWLLPKIILVVGKNWWNHNKASPFISGTPFSIFDEETRKTYRGNLDAHPSGKAWIYVIQSQIARLLAQYLSTKGPGPKENIVGYINVALRRAMINAVAKSQDKIVARIPICGYCRFKRKLVSPPALEFDKISGLYKCPVCAKELEMEEEELKQKQKEVSEKNIDREYIEDQLQTLIDQGQGNSIQSRMLQTRLKLIDQNNNQEVNEKKREMDIRRIMSTGVPLNHIICINEDCPGQKIPLSFVDWSGPFWDTDEGKQAREYLSNHYNIVEQTEDVNKQQFAEDEWDLKSSSGYRPPKRILWNVPFICPFDGARFTPLQAKGHGPIVQNTGRHLGGLIVDPPRKERFVSTPHVEKRIAPRENGAAGGGGEELSFEDLYNSSGEKIDLNSDKAEEFARARIELDRKFNEIFKVLLAKQKEYKSLIRDEAGNLKPVTMKKQQKYLLQESLYASIIDWATNNHLDFISWLYERTPKKRNVYDKFGEQVASVTEFYALDKIRASQIKASILHEWFGKLINKFDNFLPESQQKYIEEHDNKSWKSGIELLTKGKGWLTTKENDNLPSVVYFISKIEKYSPDFSIVKSHLRYGEGLPMGERSPRNKGNSKTYGNIPRLAVVYGAWEYKGKGVDDKLMATPISTNVGDRLINMLTSINVNVAYADFKSVYLRNDENLKLTEGDYVLIKASFVLDQGGIIPFKMIDNLYRDMKGSLNFSGDE